MQLQTVYKTFMTFAIMAFAGSSAMAQCENWTEMANKNDLENKHMFYRDAYKVKDYAKAYPLWLEVYQAAPAADGKRASHYRDGRTIIKEVYADETDAAKQAEMLETFIRLYDEEYECYPKNKKGKDKKAYLMENKAFELYYTFNHQRDVIFEVLEVAAEAAGKDLGYSVLYPYADIAASFFTEKKIDAQKVRDIKKYLDEVCDHNIANNAEFKAYYKQQKDLIEERIEPIAGDIYGCAYYTEKVQAKYDANPDDKNNYTDIYNYLSQNGCSDSDPLMKEIYAKMERDYDQAMAAHEEKQREKMARIEAAKASQPARQANEAFKSGDYQTAITKFEEAIAEETDNARKADYQFYIAVAYGRKLNQYSKAKSAIRKVLSFDPSYGKAYNLLGDLYAKSARSCGKNGFEQRMVILAAMNQWKKAKSVSSDPEVQSAADRNISAYAGQLPSQEDVIMNGQKVGGSYRVGCWIGETVTVKAK